MKWKGWLKNQDLRLLMELAIVGALVVAFLKIAHEVAEGTESFDHTILLALRDTPSDPIGSPGTEAAIMHLSGLGSGAVTTLVCVMAVTFLCLSGRWRYAGLVVACAVGTLLVMLVMKGIYDRPRPTIVTAIDPPGDESFPSGHSMIASALYPTLAVLVARALPTRRLRVFTVACGVFLAGMIGISRLYLGVHYPTDVLAGWTIGCTWALLCGIVARKLAPNVAAHEQPLAPDDDQPAERVRTK
ncbi:MAG: phosphatase PAP2 family protein [Deltaproteobacteria bacterium]|nr:phosphatase PAP2 family protein [Deltaproteobacteria bacterium]